MSSPVDPSTLGLGHLCLFVGLRVNELVLDRLHADGYADIRHSHGYVFQHLIDRPRTVTELAARLGVTQQAASKSVAELTELGYVTRVPSADRRARRIGLSERGIACVSHARRVRARIERRMNARHGKAAERARMLLASVLADLGGVRAVSRRAVRDLR